MTLAGIVMSKLAVAFMKMLSTARTSLLNSIPLVGTGL
jgi:hypothetical protein